MTVVTTVLPASRPASLQRDRAGREHLVAVDTMALGIGEQRPVGVAVVGDAGVGAEADDLGRHDLGVAAPRTRR